ncbi:hypothetical protein [Methylobacterium sp. J-076]|uniref:hypothetical protein n=1 Tax=Methylobacterium sp. J-076 TaxID=2836655 RepID=UPI001FBC1496|nr:hypothetical protein [Methylobacterium sp. J-076]MCJ2013898.1 hypothetical protein [Methylobacterium sp. J-076]
MTAVAVLLRTTLPLSLPLSKMPPVAIIVPSVRKAWAPQKLLMPTTPGRVTWPPASPLVGSQMSKVRPSWTEGLLAAVP